MKNKYIMLIGDGMADIPAAALGGKTPLEYARTPNMDAIARAGRIGLVKTVPDGIEPGSDVANMALMGYDPKLYYSGRAPIEAASLGVKLEPEDTAFRCNLVHLANGRMADYSAGHIETGDAHEIVRQLQAALNNDTVTLYPGVSYRHLLVIKNLPKGKLSCTPPHDISGREYAGYLPRGAGQEILGALSAAAHSVLADSPTNRKRADLGKKTASDIWLWGQGGAVSLPSLAARYDLSGSVISAVDLVRGLGVLAGLSVRVVEGATGYLGTNYQGKIDAALSALESENFVYLHVEAPDETSHEGDAHKKIQAIEEFDEQIVGKVAALLKRMPELRAIVLPDHATLISTKTHHAMPVPFAVCGRGIRPGSASAYSESAATASRSRLYDGVSLFEDFIRGDFS